MRMARLRACALLLLAGALVAAAGVAWSDAPGAGMVELGPEAAVRDPAERMQRTQLPNGLTVLTLEDHATPVVSFQMWVEVGSKDESRYKGLAHLFEHMMFNGSKHIAPEEHARLVNARGGQLNAFTTRDFTVFYEDVTSETLPLVIALEAERVANLDISEATLTRERQVVLEERRMRSEDDPSGRAFDALLEHTFVAHSYRWPTIGWRSDIEKATVDVCRRFFDTYYVPNNIVISIAGDFDSADALARIRDSFGKLEPAAEIPRNPTLEPKQDGERRVVVRFDLRSPILVAAWHAPAAGHPDADALDVLSQILSEGRSSRLYRALVHDAQAALEAQGAYWELKEAGVFYAFASARPGVGIDRVERLFMEQIARLRREPVSAAELAKAKRQLEVGYLSGLATSHALASRMAMEVATFGRVRPLQERLSAIRAVSVEDVQRVARTYLADDQRTVVQVVPPPRSSEEHGS